MKVRLLSDVLDASIKKVLIERGCHNKLGSVTLKDLFYRQVSRVEDVFKFLMQEQVGILDRRSTAQERFSTAISACVVFEVSEKFV